MDLGAAVPAAPGRAVRVGLAGAGPWAGYFHAPALAAGPATALAGIWARRAGAAAELAAVHGVPVFAAFEELLERCDAVAFCVPPQVQAALATTAARAGKPVLLEKPVAGDATAAERLADTLDAAGVLSQVVLTWRYSPVARTFLERCRAAGVVGAHASFLLGSMLSGSPFATPWRLTEGPVADLGPHVIDILDAALGRVVSIRAHGERDRVVGLMLEHENGMLSEASVSCTLPLEPMVAEVRVYTTTGTLTFDAAAGAIDDARAVVAAEFAQTAAGLPHPLDARRGLHLQRLIDQAQDGAGWGRRPLAADPGGAAPPAS